jgi:hypothetical protein
MIGVPGYEWVLDRDQQPKLVEMPKTIKQQQRLRGMAIAAKAANKRIRDMAIDAAGLAKREGLDSRVLYDPGHVRSRLHMRLRGLLFGKER